MRTSMNDHDGSIPGNALGRSSHGLLAPSSKTIGRESHGGDSSGAEPTALDLKSGGGDRGNCPWAGCQAVAPEKNLHFFQDS